MNEKMRSEISKFEYDYIVNIDITKDSLIFDGFAGDYDMEPKTIKIEALKQVLNTGVSIYHVLELVHSSGYELTTKKHADKMMADLRKYMNAQTHTYKFLS